MYISEITLKNFRNLQPCSLCFDKKLNIITGENGAGKTSLLEAIHTLSTGRSFRTKYVKRIISFSKDQFHIQAKIKNNSQYTKLSLIKRKSGKSLIELDHNKETNYSNTARLIPIQTFNPESISILISGAKNKRKIIDWGTFYTNKLFYTYWKKLSQILKHRNSALKKNYSYNVMLAWDNEIVRISNIIDKQRSFYVSQIIPIINDFLNNIPSFPKINIQYYRGWSHQETLGHILDRNYPKDKKLGYTNYGAHKADLIISSNGIPIQDSLSRGQLKLLMAIIKLSQGILLENEYSVSPIYLIDDITSELDNTFLSFFIKYILQLKSQIFLSTLSFSNIANEIKNYNFCQFNITKGEIKLIN